MSPIYFYISKIHILLISWI